MTSIQFFRLRAPDIAARCVVSMSDTSIVLSSVWTPNRAVYIFKSAEERIAIASELHQAGAVVQCELLDDSD